MSESAKIADEALVQLESMRQMTEWFGVIQPFQASVLKRALMLLTGSKKVTLTLNTDEKTMVYLYENGNPVLQAHLRAEQSVFSILGKGWTVKCGTIGPDEPRVPRKSRAAPKQKRVGGAKKARKRASK